MDFERSRGTLRVVVGEVDASVGHETRRRVLEIAESFEQFSAFGLFDLALLSFLTVRTRSLRPSP
jgi:hypothetical protein